jgi:hypothetical protein
MPRVESGENRRSGAATNARLVVPCLNERPHSSARADMAQPRTVHTVMLFSVCQVERWSKGAVRGAGNLRKRSVTVDTHSSTGVGSLPCASSRRYSLLWP